MGFLPAGYVPGMVFHGSERIDVVKMIKLNVPWDLGPIELTEPSQIYYDLVVPAFAQAAQVQAQKGLALAPGVLASFTPLEVEFYQRACKAEALAEGATLAPDCLHILLSGSITSAGRTLQKGDWLGAEALLKSGQSGAAAVAGAQAQVLTLAPEGLARLVEQYPRLAVKLYQNLAAASNTLG